MNTTVIPQVLQGNLTITGSIDGGGFGWVIPILAVGFASLGLVLLFYISSSFKKYERFVRVLRAVARSANYAAYGALTVVIVAVPAVALYHGFNAISSNPGALIEVGKWAGILGGSYIGLSLLGFITKKRVWKRLKSYREVSKNVNTGEKSNVIQPMGNGP